MLWPIWARASQCKTIRHQRRCVDMTLVEQRTISISEAGWYPDPNREHRLRYHDGQTWTPHVTHFGPSPCHGCFYESDR